jgi:hypothetical protein
MTDRPSPITIVLVLVHDGLGGRTNGTRLRQAYGATGFMGLMPRGLARNLSFVICHLSFRSGLALPFLPFLRYIIPAISNLVSYSVNSEPNPLAASCKLDASVSLSRS